MEGKQKREREEAAVDSAVLRPTPMCVWMSFVYMNDDSM